MASLKGIRVLEMAQIMAGPTCGLLLADLGAEVIKIEKTPGGDDTRNFLPPDVNGVSAAYLMMNRNKKGIALNLKDKKGIEIFKTMIKNSDVVLENFRKGTLEKLGIGYDTISKTNPKIILLDEPFANLDPTTQIRLKKIIKTLSQKVGVTVLVSSHDLQDVTEVSDRIVLLEKGLIIKDIKKTKKTLQDLETYFNKE